MVDGGPHTLELFWRKFRNATQRVLMLDYDGTLAPFRVERDRALPYPGVRGILEAIQAAGQTRMIIISGRAAADLLPLLGLDTPPEIWGSHGFERRFPDGSREIPELDGHNRQQLEAAYYWMANHGYAADCEKKPASLAFHWRRRAPARQKQLEEIIRAAWAPFTDKDGLQIHPFDGGLELRYTGFHKGRAVKQVLADCGPESAVAYLGDDLTDEDAFRELKGRGLTVLVRPTYRQTLADCWLKPPGELLDFLQTWHSYSVKYAYKTATDTQ